jgi:hypothetical protein
MVAHPGRARRGRACCTACSRARHRASSAGRSGSRCLPRPHTFTIWCGEVESQVTAAAMQHMTKVINGELSLDSCSICRQYLPRTRSLSSVGCGQAVQKHTGRAPHPPQSRRWSRGSGCCSGARSRTPSSAGPAQRPPRPWAARRALRAAAAVLPDRKYVRISCSGSNIPTKLPSRHIHCQAASSGSRAVSALSTVHIVVRQPVFELRRGLGQARRRARGRDRARRCLSRSGMLMQTQQLPATGLKRPWVAHPSSSDAWAPSKPMQAGRCPLCLACVCTSPVSAVSIPLHPQP